MTSESGAGFHQLPFPVQNHRHNLLPISLVVPGSQIPFTRTSDRDKATLDLIGLVSDSERHPITRIRDTVKLAVDTSSEVRRKNVQYDTGVDLPPGNYHLKFVVRENQTGRMGSFETDLNVPDLKWQPLKRPILAFEPTEEILLRVV